MSSLHGFAARGAGFPFDNLITVSSSNFTSNTAETGGIVYDCTCTELYSN